MKLVKNEKNVNVPLLILQQANCWLSRDQLRRGDKIKNDAFSREFHFSEKFRKSRASSGPIRG